MIPVLRFIGRLTWTIVRICLVVLLAIVLGGFRGASKARMTSSSPRD
jgi:hypothetical protein